MQAKQRQTTFRAARVLLALVLAAGLIPLASLACSRQAYAGTGWLSVGRSVYYDNYDTNYFSDGNGWTAYCAQPSKPTPAPGTYQKLSLRDAYEGGSGVGSPAAVLYFGYGGPGFDPAMWPASWYDGSPMTDDNYYAITHILLADRMYWDSEAALTGCSTAFRQYYGYFCQGQEWWVKYVGMGSEANYDGVYMRMIAAWQALPSSAQNAYIDSCYALSTGGASQTVVVASPNEPAGDLELQKSSAVPSITDGNACYSLEGAVYGVYRDEACASEAAEITTDANGWARAEGLDVGTYYVKEKTPSEGYALDEAVHEVTIAGGQTTSLDVEEVPQSSPAALWLSKTDLETGSDLPQGAAALAGAQFSVRYYDGYYDTAAQAEASGAPERSWLVSTDENGHAPLSNAHTLWGESLLRNSRGQAAIPLGTVLIQEVKAPQGYLVGEGETFIRQITSEGTTEDVRTYNAPAVGEQVVRGGVEMPKLDFDRQAGTPQGDATLDGAQFTIRNASAKSVVVDGVEYAPGQDVKTIATVGGTASTDARALPFGDYELRETAAPDGYHLTAETWRFQVREEGVVVKPSSTAEKIDNAVVRGGMSIEKRDVESQLLDPLGSASLDGTTFDIANRSAHAVYVDGAWREPGEVVATVTVRDGVASTAADALPYGTYAVRETSAGTGYLLTDQAERTFQIREEGVVVALGADGSSDDAAYDQVKRGDLEFVKARESDQKRLASVPFKITSQTTGEWHVIVTDENGEAKTSAAWNAHTARTNANDAALGDDGAVDEEKLDASAGVWFGLTPTGTQTAPDDGLAALPYDTYLIEELPVTANENLELITLGDVTVTRDGYCINLGTFDDQPAGEVSISTSARDALDGDKVLLAAEDACVIDRVEYSGLTIGKPYVLTGMLVDKATGEAVQGADGQGVTASCSFTPEKTSGYAELSFTFDALALGGHDVVCFEKLAAAEAPDTAIAAHEDLGDYEQTVRVKAPMISTKAADVLDGDVTAASDVEVCVVDKVSYRNLVADGRAYVARGTLMDKATGEIYRDADGNEVTAQTEFTPEEQSGTVDVSFTFNAAGQDDVQIVIFEELSANGRVLATHADLESTTQTVELESPAIFTTATDAADGDHVVCADPESSIVDTVTYEGLAPGRSYTVFGALMTVEENEEGALEAAPLLDAEGNPVTSSATFTPEEQSGTVEVAFSFDSTGLAGRSLVAFEKLLRADAVVASHEDPADEGQTVRVVAPRIGTLAADGADADKLVVADARAAVIDTVSLEGIVPGCSYEVQGELMALAEDEQGTLSATPVAAAATAFTAEAADQTVEVAFAFDASDLGGRTLVAFERLVRENAVVAAHEDLADEGQSVKVVAPRLATEATDASDFDHAVTAKGEATVVDAVTYENLVPGREYHLRGTIMDKKTGEELIVNDRVIQEEATFVPEQPSGTVKLEFTFDASELAGRALVAFEELSCEGRAVAEHADLEDEGQTVYVEKERKATITSSMPKTGDSSRAVQLAAALAATAAAAALLAARARTRRKR